jgi:hypothetical protein
MHEKITKSENATIAESDQNGLISAGLLRIPGILARFDQINGQIPAGFWRSQYSGGWMLLDSGAAWILTTDHRWIPTIGYQKCVQRPRV